MVKICTNHQHYQVPVIFTFAFPGAEYWCPFCGELFGMINDLQNIHPTEQLEFRVKKFRELSKNYLHAKMIEHAVLIRSPKGGYMRPDELPEHDKALNEHFIREYKFRLGVEEFEPEKIARCSCYPDCSCAIEGFENCVE